MTFIEGVKAITTGSTIVLWRDNYVYKTRTLKPGFFSDLVLCAIRTIDRFYIVITPETVDLTEPVELQLHVLYQKHKRDILDREKKQAQADLKHN